MEVIAGIGPLPAGWSTHTGAEITELIGKGASPRWQGFAYSDHGMLFVTSENVRDGYLDVSSPKFLPLAFHEKLSRTKLRRNDILVNLVGASIGRSCRVKTDLDPANVNQAVAVFRLRNPNSAPYVEYFFQSPTTIKRILEMQADAARPNISLGNLRDFVLVLPPPEEQRAIAGVLGDVDALLGALEKLIAKKRDLKQAAMQQLLTGETRLPGFHGEWSAAKISELCEYEAGVATAGGEQGYVEIGDIDVESKSYDVDGKDKPAVRGAVKVPGGTLLISTVRPTRGAIAITREEIYVSSAFCRLRPANGFLFHLACQAGFLAYLGEKSFGGTYPTCRDETILSYECLVPNNTEEQRAIAEVLSDMDGEIAALEQRLAKTRALKQGMMQELLTGRVRLI
jgi:type I restriction enzyme S subunit